MSNVTTVPIEIVDKATGHVSIMHFVTEARDGARVAWRREASDANIAAELVKSGQVLANVTWRRIAMDDIPQNRLFRNCWRSDGGKIAVDMTLARDETLTKMRRRGEVSQKTEADVAVASTPEELKAIRLA